MKIMRLKESLKDHKIQIQDSKIMIMNSMIMKLEFGRFEI